MKKTIPLLIIAAICTANAANATDFTFTATSGDWDVDTNWTPSGGPPGDTDSATIPSGKTCFVDTDEECDSIDVAGTLEIEAAASLTLRPEAGEDSVVSSTVKLTGSSSNTAELIIDGEVEIIGDLGELIMVYGLIKPKNASGDKLTLLHDHVQSFPFEVHGHGEISVALDSAVRVVADQSQKTLTLTGGDKDGTGDAAEWQALDGGTLEINCDVTGNARWKQITGGAYTMIVIKHCVSVTGDVTIKTGTFDVQETFCTSGDLIWMGNTGIDVSSGASTSFGETCSAICS